MQMRGIGEITIASNVPCTNEQGVYDGWITYSTSNGELAPNQAYSVDLGRQIPEAIKPAELFSWVNDRADQWRREHRAPVVPRERIMSTTITRLCFSETHIGEPHERPGASRWHELVTHMFQGRPGAKPVGIEEADADPMLPDFAAMLKFYRKRGELPRGFLILPVREVGEKHLVTRAIALNVPNRRLVHPSYAGLRAGMPRGSQHIVYPRQLAEPGSTLPPLPPIPTMDWRPAERREPEPRKFRPTRPPVVPASSPDDPPPF